MAKQAAGPLEFTIFFDIDPGGVLEVIGGTVHVTGTWNHPDKELYAVFVAIAEGEVPDHLVPLHPWDDPSLTPTQGDVTVDHTGLAGDWSCNAITARGNCEIDTAIAWGFFDEIAAPISAKRYFKGDSEGTGCGSGSGSGSGTAPAITKLSTLVMPRFYRLTPDVPSMALSGSGQKFLVEGGFFKDGVILEYDEDRSTPQEMIWRNLEPSLSGTKWMLRVSQGRIRIVAEATMQRGGESTVQTPFVWRCNSWKPTGKSVLHCDVNAVGFGLPSIYLEPLE